MPQAAPQTRSEAHPQARRERDRLDFTLPAEPRAAADAFGEAAPLYEKRKSVFPKAIDGKFRRIKWFWMGVTLAIYYVTPWLRWDRGPYT